MNDQDVQRIDHDLECIKCGYNLRTMSWNERCPECGAAVVKSLIRPTGEPPAALSFFLAIFGLVLAATPLLAQPAPLERFLWLSMPWLVFGAECAAMLFGFRSLSRLGRRTGMVFVVTITALVVSLPMFFISGAAVVAVIMYLARVS